MAGEIPNEVEVETLEDLVRELKTEFEQILPYLLDSLKRNQSFDELSRRLREADRKLAAVNDRPIVISLLRTLNIIRRLDMPDDNKNIIVDDIVSVLKSAGYDELQVSQGDLFDPNLHEAVDGDVDGTTAVVREVYGLGLTCLGEVVRPARVSIGPKA